MKKGNLSDNKDSFYYKDTHRLSEKNYILAVKDISSNTNVKTILYVSEKRILDIAEDMGEKIWTVPNNSSSPDVASLSTRFLENQLIKINKNQIVDNLGYHRDNENFAKCKTFNSNLSSLNENEIVEIFEGILFDKTAVLKLSEIGINYLIKNYFLQTNNCFFCIEKEFLKGPFKVKSVNDTGDIIVEKSSWKQFGLYEFNDSSFVEFEGNGILRRVIIPYILNA